MCDECDDPDSPGPEDFPEHLNEDPDDNEITDERSAVPEDFVEDS